MRRSIVFMFSGQGSQYYQMGRELFVHHHVFRKWMFRLDKIAQEISGVSIIEKLYSDEKRVSQQFNRTLYTHPAIFMVEYAMAQVLLESGIEPDYVLGASLGEFASAAVASVSAVDETLEAVIRQAQVIESNCPDGGMLAIIHDFSLYQETPLIYENSDLASVNFRTHFVVSGKKDNLEVVEKFLKSKDIIYQKLPVSYGFHSSLINPAENYYMEFLKGKFFREPQVSLLSSVTGTILNQLPNGYLWDIIKKPINLSEAIRGIEKAKIQNMVYLDLGPSGTMANISKQNIDINSQSEVYSVITPFNQDLKNLKKILEKLVFKI